MPDDRSEEAAIDSVARPATDALQVLVDHHRAFLRFLEARVGDRPTAEDLLQDAFGRALQRLDSIRDQESAVAWFYRVLRNAVIDHARRGAARSRAIDAFARELDGTIPPPDVHRAICGCVATLARSLKPAYAEALERIDVEGVPVKSYAEQAGISPNNAGVRIFRAREALRRQVVVSCGTCAEHGCLDCTCGTGRRPRTADSPSS